MKPPSVSWILRAGLNLPHVLLNPDSGTLAVSFCDYFTEICFVPSSRLWCPARSVCLLWLAAQPAVSLSDEVSASLTTHAMHQCLHSVLVTCNNSPEFLQWRHLEDCQCTSSFHQAKANCCFGHYALLLCHMQTTNETNQAAPVSRLTQTAKGALHLCREIPLVLRRGDCSLPHTLCHIISANICLVDCPQPIPIISPPQRKISITWHPCNPPCAPSGLVENFIALLSSFEREASAADMISLGESPQTSFKEEGWHRPRC